MECSSGSDGAVIDGRPPKLAADAIDTEEALVHYRRVRDEIQTYVRDLPQALDSAGGRSD